MLLPTPERIPRIVAEGRRLAKRVAGPDRPPQVAPAGGAPTRHRAWLIHGECLDAMATLLAAPGPAAHRGRLDLVWLEADPTGCAHRDATAWLARLAAQLELARLLLRTQGQLWLDIDRRCAHDARLLLDACYGAGAFAAGIAWQPRPPMQRTVLACLKRGRRRPRSSVPHDDDGYVSQRFPNIEAATGRRYWLDAATWRHHPEGLDRMKADGRVVVSRAGVPYVKRYSTDGAEADGARLQARLEPADAPVESLLARILGFACPDGGLVGGFGSDPLAFASAAAALGLRWTSAGSDRAAYLAACAALPGAAQTLASCGGTSVSSGAAPPSPDRNSGSAAPTP